MPTSFPDQTVIEAPAEPNQAIDLALCTEKLAALRFLILLTAKWESSARLNRTRRAQLRSELMELRAAYAQRLDEIAMKFCVQQAMDAKESVERAVTVPGDLPAAEPGRDWLALDL